jgi:hypothetical protein
MAAHTRLAFHEWIRLQLCHLIGVTGFASAESRRAREVRCCCLAMARGAFDSAGGMRAGFPLVIDRLVAGGTGISGWNQPMEDMGGLILLSDGRLDGNRQNEKSEQGETEHARTETIHGQTPEYGLPVSNRRLAAISDTDHVSPDAIRALAARPFAKGMSTYLQNEGVAPTGWESGFRKVEFAKALERE